MPLQMGSGFREIVIDWGLVRMEGWRKVIILFVDGTWRQAAQPVHRGRHTGNQQTANNQKRRIIGDAETHRDEDSAS